MRLTSMMPKLSTKSLVEFVRDQFHYHRPAASLVLAAMFRNSLTSAVQWSSVVCRPGIVLSTLYLVMISLRFVVIFTCSLDGWDSLREWYYRYDVLLLHLTGAVTGDRKSLALCLAPAPIFFLYTNYVFEVQRHNPVWDMLAEVFVLNPMHFWPLNQARFSEPSSLFHFASIRKIWNDCEGGVRFNYHQLPRYHRHWDCRTRTRLNVILFYSEPVHWLTEGGIKVLLCLMMLGYLTVSEVLSRASASGTAPMLLLAGDLMLTQKVFMSGCRSTLFGTHINVCHRFGLTSHLRHLERGLGAVVAMMTQSEAPIVRSRWRQSRVALGGLVHYRSAHVSVLHTLITLEKRMISRMGGVIALTTLPVSVYFQSILWTQPRPSLVRSAMALLLTTHIVISCTVVDTLHSLAQAWHRSHRLLFQCLTTSTTTTKWLPLVERIRLGHHYELVHSVNRFRFSLGCLGAISRASMLKFCIVYFSFIFYLNKLFIKRIFAV